MHATCDLNELRVAVKALIHPHIKLQKTPHSYLAVSQTEPLQQASKAAREEAAEASDAADVQERAVEPRELDGQ
jgi:hypothetical protein